LESDNFNIRLEHLNTYVTDASVESIFQAYQPKIIIWGWYDAISITVYIKASDISITPSSLKRTQTIIDPEKLQIQITEQVPQKAIFMAFFVAGLERFISTDDENADLYFRKAEELKEYNNDDLDLLYYYLGSVNTAIPNREDAFKYLQLAIELNPTAITHFALGNVYYHLDGNLDSAIDQYNTAIDKNDKMSVIYLNRGSAYSDRGVANSEPNDYTLAIKDFNKAIELAKGNAIAAYAYYNRGNAYFRDNQFDLAKKDYDFVINNLLPDYAEAYNARALVFTNNNNKDDDTKALSDFNKAIELNPNFIDAYYNRGKYYGRSGDSISAISDFELLIKIDPSNYEYYYYLALSAGQQWIKTNETQEDYYNLALQNLNKCIEINDTFVEAYLDRGSLYGMKHNFTDGVNDYSQVIALDPNNVKAYYFRGLAYMTYGYKDEAISDFQKVLQLNPDSSIRSAVQKYLTELQSSP
jgi:tetratricopeptide (TPR) repeat protein